ncbi:hypothetical protein BDN72DRAFT_776080, partial [Pluteus cervinus]
MIDLLAVNKQLRESLSSLNHVPWLSGTFCLTGTRVEILQLIQSWTRSANSQMFWLHGQAGSGKSTTVQTTFQWLQQNHIPSALYTCSKTQTELHSPLNVLPTLCYQLCMLDRVYGQYIASEFQNNPLLQSGLGHIATQLELLFLAPFQMARISFGHGVVVILDALDEC